MVFKEEKSDTSTQIKTHDLIIKINTVPFSYSEHMEVLDQLHKLHKDENLTREEKNIKLREITKKYRGE